MAREFKRTDRVSEQLQRELAKIIQLEMKDPRLGMVTVCQVNLSNDLHYANVYVTFLGIDEDEASIKKAVGFLNDAGSFIRTLLAKRMSMRAVPHITFLFDESIVRGRHLSNLIKKACDSHT
jgi:ribosome-binding factor A